MEATVINPFLTASIQLVQTMFRLEATSGAPYLMGKEIAHRWEISGILGVTGEYQGIVALRLSRVLANKMLERTGLKTNSEDERQDLLFGMIGEMVNVVAGNASNLIADRIDISPPVVVYGQNHSIAWPRTIPVIAIPFVTDLGPFEVAVCFKYRDMLRG
jgi:chemotaxis protein CheX